MFNPRLMNPARCQIQPEVKGDQVLLDYFRGKIIMKNL